MEGAAVGRAVSEEDHGDGAGLLVAGRQGRAHGQAVAAAHHAVGAQHPHAEVRNVLGAALAPAVAGGLAVQLRHHGLEVRALGDGVPVAPVGAGDVVLLIQAGAHAGGDGLLANVDVDVPQKFAGLTAALGLQVKFADLDHCFVMVQQFFSCHHQATHLLAFTDPVPWISFSKFSGRLLFFIVPPGPKNVNRQDKRCLPGARQGRRRCGEGSRRSVKPYGAVGERNRQDRTGRKRRDPRRGTRWAAPQPWPPKW